MWWACDRCAGLVEDDRFDALTDLVLDLAVQRMTPAPSKYALKVMREVLTRTYASFRRCRTGPPTRYVPRTAS